MADPIPVFNSPAPLNPDDFVREQDRLEVFIAKLIEPEPAVLVTIPPNKPYPEGGAT